MNDDVHYQTGYVYFVQAGDDQIVKIGSTIEEPEKRMRALQTACPQRLRMLGAIDLFAQGVIARHRGEYASLARKRERAIQAEFAADRLHGEWFRLTDRLRAFIEQQVRVGDAIGSG